MGVKTAYFDTNVYFDVFEHREPTLFSELEVLVKQGKVDVVVSDLNLIESLTGNHRPSFSSGVQNLLSLSPKWLYLTGATSREVLTKQGDAKQIKRLEGVGTLLSWPEIAKLILDAEALTTIPGLAIPTAPALLQAYPPGSVAERLKYWKKELKTLEGDVKKMMTFVLTSQNVFRKVVASTLGMSLGATRTIADELWDDPDLAPAFRLNVELSCQVLNVTNPKWTTNDFLDHGHVGALPYLDLFVTRDGLGKTPGLIQEIDWYDTNIRNPRGKQPYADKVCRGWDEFLARA